MASRGKSLFWNSLLVVFLLAAVWLEFNSVHNPLAKSLVILLTCVWVYFYARLWKNSVQEELTISRFYRFLKVSHKETFWEAVSGATSWAIIFAIMIVLICAVMCWLTSYSVYWSGIFFSVIAMYGAILCSAYIGCKKAWLKQI